MNQFFRLKSFLWNKLCKKCVEEVAYIFYVYKIFVYKLCDLYNLLLEDMSSAKDSPPVSSKKNIMINLFVYNYELKLGHKSNVEK